MATGQRACRIADWPIGRASALLVAAFFIFGEARAESRSRPGDITAIAPGAILDRQPVEPGPVPRQATTETSLRGNPLWAVPLEALMETRARPLFSPSRRPPPPPVVAASPPAPPPKPPAPREPDQPRLTLVGTVTGASDRIGIFVDESSKDVIRMRIGETHAGWILRSVHRRAASFAKDRQEATLAFPNPGAAQPVLSVGGPASKIDNASVCGQNRNVAGASANCAPAAAPIIPASAPTTRSAHKVRQDVLSIGARD
jgi:general secretion pathway protein N